MTPDTQVGRLDEAFGEDREPRPDGDRNRDGPEKVSPLSGQIDA